MDLLYDVLFWSVPPVAAMAAMNTHRSVVRVREERARYLKSAENIIRSRSTWMGRE